LAVADVNGDGKPDLVLANNCAIGGSTGCPEETGVVGVLLGNGDGTFQAAVAYGSGGYTAGGSGHGSVAVADVNGDGKPDLVVANECGNNRDCPAYGTVGVLLGNGDGTFQSAVAYGSGGYDANSVAVADVNGDGKPDLVVANLCGDNNPNGNCNGTVGVLLNTTPWPYKAFVQPPINVDGSSIFKANRGVIPVKFSLTINNTPTCALPTATISVTRTAGGVIGSVDESTYTMAADSGSSFRIDSSACQYIYNLGASALGVGTYRVDVSIDGNVVGNAVFALK
jgi:hypothetical protein